MYMPRDKERAMYIYKQRKEGKRTFADIGRELGLTLERTRQIYRRTDWTLNGENADHHQKETRPRPKKPRLSIEEIIRDTNEGPGERK